MLPRAKSLENAVLVLNALSRFWKDIYIYLFRIYLYHLYPYFNLNVIVEQLKMFCKQSMNCTHSFTLCIIIKYYNYELYQS